MSEYMAIFDIRSLLCLLLFLGFSICAMLFIIDSDIVFNQKLLILANIFIVQTCFCALFLKLCKIENDKIEFKRKLDYSMRQIKIGCDLLVRQKQLNQQKQQQIDRLMG